MRYVIVFILLLPSVCSANTCSKEIMKTLLNFNLSDLILTKVTSGGFSSSQVSTALSTLVSKKCQTDSAFEELDNFVLGIQWIKGYNREPAKYEIKKLKKKITRISQKYLPGSKDGLQSDKAMNIFLAALSSNENAKTSMENIAIALFKQKWQSHPAEEKIFEHIDRKPYKTNSWLSLNHYNEEHGSSEIISEDFFISKYGAFSSAIEYLALLDSILEGNKKVLCYHVSQYNLSKALIKAHKLNNELNYYFDFDPSTNCSDYKKFTNSYNNGDAALVVLSGDMDKSFASWFGKTVLRLKDTEEDEYAYLIFGVPDEELHGKSEFIEGVFSDLRGVYQLISQDKYDIIYRGRKEDVYPLKMTHGQKTVFIANIWDKTRGYNKRRKDFNSHVRFDYIFSSKNCIYQTLNAVEFLSGKIRRNASKRNDMIYDTSTLVDILKNSNMI